MEYRPTVPPAVPHDASDEMLMVRYQRGDRHAFAELVRRHHRRVYNFALLQLRSERAAEDAAEDAFRALVQNAARFKHEARFSTWLYRIVHEVCLKALASGQAGRVEPSAEPTDALLLETEESGVGRHSAPGLERAKGASVIAASVIAALDELPNDQRAVLLLKEVAQLPLRDIAEVTDTTEHAVKTRLRYALDRLQRVLSGFEEYARALR